MSQKLIVTFTYVFQWFMHAEKGKHQKNMFFVGSTSTISLISNAMEA